MQLVHKTPERINWMLRNEPLAREGIILVYYMEDEYRIYRDLAEALIKVSKVMNGYRTVGQLWPVLVHVPNANAAIALAKDQSTPITLMLFDIQMSKGKGQTEKGDDALAIVRHSRPGSMLWIHSTFAKKGRIDPTEQQLMAADGLISKDISAEDRARLIWQILAFVPATIDAAHDLPTNAEGADPKFFHMCAICPNFEPAKDQRDGDGNPRTGNCRLRSITGSGMMGAKMALYPTSLCAWEHGPALQENKRALGTEIASAYLELHLGAVRDFSPGAVSARVSIVSQQKAATRTRFRQQFEYSDRYPMVIDEVNAHPIDPLLLSTAGIPATAMRSLLPPSQYDDLQRRFDLERKQELEGRVIV